MGVCSGNDPKRKDQKDFKDNRDKDKFTCEGIGFAAVTLVPLRNLMDTFFL